MARQENPKQLLLNTRNNIKCIGQNYVLFLQGVCLEEGKSAVAGRKTYKGDKMIEKMKTSRIVGMFAALFIATMFLTSSMVVLADTEPNDTFATAETTYDGATETGTLDEYTDSDDYYRIWLDSGYTLTVSMTGTGDDFDLELYDPNEWEVDYSWSFGSTETVSHTATESCYH